MSAEDAQGTTEQSFAALQALVADKRRKLGRRYEDFIGRVAEVLCQRYPAAFTMDGTQLRDLIATVEVIGEESRGLLKKLGDYCAGCGWCCSKTSKIVVTGADVERISHALKKKTDELFKFDGIEWTIKQGHPCQWWNPRNKRCSIYNIRPQVCRIWPLAINEKGQKSLQSMAECEFAVLVLADKVAKALQGAA